MGYLNRCPKCGGEMEDDGMGLDCLDCGYG